MKPNTLTLMVGLPYSGKTTLAQEMGHPIVCPDAIRIALHGQRFASEAEDMVWAIAKVMVRALFLAGHSNVILDACNTTEKRRKVWRSPDWQVRCHVVGTSREECERRARSVNDNDILPVIERMATQYEPVSE